MKEKTMDNVKSKELLSQFKSALISSEMSDEEKLSAVMIVVLSLLESMGSTKLVMSISNGKKLIVELSDSPH
ncbi:MAG: hypothetical protein ACRDAL_12975 [Plesiomonas shigelloides]